MTYEYTDQDLAFFEDLRSKGCAVCVFLPQELGDMPQDDAEEIMCVAVNDRVQPVEEI